MIRVRSFVASAAAALVLSAATASAQETTESWAKFSGELAEALERRGAADDAVEEWLALAQLRPGDVGPYARAAMLAVDAPPKRNTNLKPGSPAYRLAEECVRQGLARGGQSDPSLAYAWGRLAFAEGRWGVAWKQLGRAKDWGFDPVRARYWHYRAAVNRSLLLVEGGRAQEAVDELKALLASSPDHPDEGRLLVNLATAEWRVQDVKSATKILDDLIAKSPGVAEAYLVQGMILADQGDFDGAQRRLREAMLHASASYGDKVYRDALLQLSAVEVKRGKLDEAEAAAKQFLNLSKDDPDGLFALGVVMKARNDLDGAVRKFRQAARLKSDSLVTLVNLKQVLSQLGENAEAEEIGKRIDEIRRKHDQDMRDAGGSPSLKQDVPGQDGAAPANTPPPK